MDTTVSNLPGNRPLHADQIADLDNKYAALVINGQLDALQLQQAGVSARRRSIDIEDVLLAEYHLSAADIGAALASHYQLPYQAFDPHRIKPIELLKNLKRDYLLQHQWIPLETLENAVVVMALDADQIRHARVISNIYPRARLQFRITTRLDFLRTLAQFFDHADVPATVRELLSDMQSEEDDGDNGASDLAAASQNEVVQLVNKIILDAHAGGVSDIHIEPAPGREKTVVRFRKDGALQSYIEVPASYRKALAARIKIMGDLDISEHRRPQDGKIRFRKYGPLDIELRVATLPTAGGLEDIVLRLLAVGEPVPLAQLGILPANLARLKHLIEKPHGIFFVCGPTGAGKTTTMHSLLQHLNRSDTKIWTAEDPVEITQKGLRQVQVNRKTGLDFATVMRAFLRADPDIIMVGEMRDRETVAIGIEASLTGHLVFATLHTNSAPESIQRLLDMGMDPYNFSDALLGILAQRLARRLCSHCKQAYHPTDDELHLLASEYCEERLHGVQDPADRQSMICATVQTWKRRHHRQAASAPSGRAQATPGNADALRELDALLLYRAVGCGMCSGGYAGRIGLHELMAGTEHLKQLIARRAPHAALMATALQDGMMTLKMDGVEKVLAGETDLNQVRHVCTR